MKTYLVRWEIEIDAKSPKKAAKEALKIQRDLDSMAVFFDVKEKDKVGGRYGWETIEVVE